MKKNKYILNKLLNENYSLYKQLSSVYGLGWSSSFRICTKFGICKFTKVKYINHNLILKIENYIISNRSFILNADLQKFEYQNIKKLKDTKHYRGLRHLYNLSVRGQRTKTNCKTQKLKNIRKYKKVWK